MSQSLNIFLKQIFAGVGACHIDLLGIFSSTADQFAAVASIDWKDGSAPQYVSPYTNSIISTNILGCGWAFTHQYNFSGSYQPVVTVTHGDGTVTTHTTFSPIPISIIPSSWSHYYFSPNGNDANSGLSPATPMKSWAKARSLAKPNTILDFLDGTFTLDAPLAIQTNFIIRGTGNTTLLMPQTIDQPHFNSSSSVLAATIAGFTVTSDAAPQARVKIKPRFMTGRGKNIVIRDLGIGELDSFLPGVNGDGFSGVLILNCIQAKPNSVREYWMAAMMGDHIHVYLCQSPGTWFQPCFRWSGTGVSYSSVQHCLLGNTSTGFSGANLRNGYLNAWDSLQMLNTQLSTAPRDNTEFVSYCRFSKINLVTTVGSQFSAGLDLRPNTQNCLFDTGTISGGSNPPVYLMATYPNGQSTETGKSMDGMILKNDVIRNFSASVSDKTKPFARLTNGLTTGVTLVNDTINGQPGKIST